MKHTAAAGLVLLASLPFVVGARAGRAAQPAAVPARQSAPSGVVVIKFGWSKERIDWERDPFAGPIENFDEMRLRARNEQRIEAAKKGGTATELDRARRDARTDAAILKQMRQDSRAARYAFMYKVTVANEGDKEIKSIDWDYIFRDAATGEELNRHRFTSEGRIGAGRKKELSFIISAPPTRTISVQTLDDKQHLALGEEAILVSVLYADGTVWRRR